MTPTPQSLGRIPLDRAPIVVCITAKLRGVGSLKVLAAPIKTGALVIYSHVRIRKTGFQMRKKEKK